MTDNKPNIAVESLVGSQIRVYCSQVLENHMKCPRIAVWSHIDDPGHRLALCNVCYAMASNPPDYTDTVPLNTEE
jgi:hypothetical protein